MMNMNHAERKLSTCSKRMNGIKQAMDVSLFEKENQKKSNSMEKQDVSKKMDGI